MKFVKVFLLPALLAIIVYFIYSAIQSGSKPHSPLPEEGIKVIQITPTK